MIRVPVEIEQALRHAASVHIEERSRRGAALQRAIVRRSHLYTSEREQIGEAVTGAADLAARVLFFSVADAAKVHVPLAELAARGKGVPQIVRDAYGNENFELGPNYIIPKPFDPRILTYVVPAVAQAAMDSGVARRKVDIVEYGHQLSKTAAALSNM